MVKLWDGMKLCIKPGFLAQLCCVVETQVGYQTNGDQTKTAQSLEMKMLWKWQNEQNVVTKNHVRQYLG